MSRIADLVAGPVNAPSPLMATSPVLWPIAALTLMRLAYGVDTYWHVSPQMFALGGMTFSNAWGAISVLAAAVAFAGLAVTVRTGRARLELIGQAACAALSAGFVAGVVWNTFHTLPDQGFVPAWQTLGFGLVAAWRAHQIGFPRGGPTRRRRGRR